MDIKTKKSCPKCNQPYRLTSLSPLKGCNIPLFLPCGHTTCEKCISTIIKCSEPIECNICHRDIDTPTPDTILDKKKLYQIFPVSVHMLGEIVLEVMQCKPDSNDKEENYYINIQDVLNITTEMETNLISCKVHKRKCLEYYCKTCTKTICIDCLMVGGAKSCKNHDLVPIQEVNQQFFEDLSEITPKVNDTFKRLTKTAVDVGNILYKYEHDNKLSNFSTMIDNTEQQFSKLLASIQKHKEEVIGILIKEQNAEKESLLELKNDLADSLKKAKLVLNALNSLNPEEDTMLCLPELLNAANDIIQTPWCLKKDESHDDDLQVIVKEELCSLVADYVHLEGADERPVYKLYSTAELREDGADVPPAPAAVVFPPELAKDVRQLRKKTELRAPEPPAFYKDPPSYRSKRDSRSSTGSLGAGDDPKNTMKNTTPDSELNRPIQRVQPLSDNEYKFSEGSQQLIYITHIVNPHNFFVQKASHQKWIKEMWREFRDSAASHLLKPTIKHSTEGKSYLALNKADNVWQRCRVVKVDRRNAEAPLYHVFCYDFGSTEVVSIDMLRVIPPLYTHNPPPLAFNCRLANCEPLGDAWTEKDAVLIQNIVNNKQAVIHVRRVAPSAEYGTTLHCDVTAYEDGASVAHALVFHERSRMPQPRLKYPEISCRNEKLSIFVNNYEYKPKAKEEVCITHVDSPDKFFVRKNYLQKVYDKLCEDLEREYLRDNTKIYSPVIGMWCVVRTGGLWARAKVVALPGRLRVRVWLADCGREVDLPWGELRPLRRQFITLRALVTKCYLTGVTPLQVKWSSAAAALLLSFAVKPLELLVDEVRRDAVGVTLHDRSIEDEPLCVNYEMIKYKFATSRGLFTFNKDRNLENQTVTSETLLDRPPHKRNHKKTDQVKILQKEKSPQQIEEKHLDAKDKGPVRLEAQLLNYQSPSQFYVSVVEQQEVFYKLYDEIQRYYIKTKTEGRTDFAVGDRCCTVCMESNTWRRCVILEIDENDAKVFFTDFACVETVPVSNLRELAKDFISIGDAAVECHLCGVIPASGDEWPSITKEYLKEMLDIYRRVYITRVGDFKNKSIPVELWVRHVTAGGALEPDTVEWRCLNKKIIEQGLGVPDKSQQYIAAAQCALDITGSALEKLQVEPHSSASATAFAESDAEGAAAFAAADTVLIDDWLPPEPLSSNEFTGIPTYIDDTGMIYIHEVTQQHTLEMIRDALKLLTKGPHTKAKYQKWSVGEPCIALYYLDNLFYRGRVVEVNDDTSTCLIHYVDYGNEELCSYENIRKNIVLHEIPIQAHKCGLKRIRPPTGNRWDTTTLDYLHKCIVEKTCLIKVTGEVENDIIPIDLKCDKLWIIDHLVEFELAVYTDGSGAVKREFVGKPVESCQVELESEPDYFIEDDPDATLASHDSSKTSEAVDWIKMMESSEKEDPTDGIYIAYPESSDVEFKCNITLVNSIHLLEVTTVDEEDNDYKDISERIQREADCRPPVNGVYENKACVARFHEDGKWYRASILQYCDVKGEIKVRFVDYGNIEVVSLADAREIDASWALKPPAARSVQLHSVRTNPELEESVIMQHYVDLFLNKGPFKAKVVSYDDGVPSVELWNDNDQLVYKELIRSGVLLKEGATGEGDK